VDKPIVDIISDVVTQVSTEMLPYLKAINVKYTGVRYDYGHPEDIVGRLEALSRTEANRNKSLPMIGLFLDIEEEKVTDLGIESKANLHLFIAVGTKQSYTPQERTEKTIIPLVRPIYRVFIKALIDSPFVEVWDNNKLPHNYTEKYQWGKSGLKYYTGKTENIFNDFIDAAEITDLQIRFKQQC
jgi:hypothetical protein